MYKILAINPGSTSTKIAVYADQILQCQHSIRHSVEELQPFKTVMKQFEFRKQLILNLLKNEKIELNTFSAVIGRGGLLRPVQSGVYRVNSQMLSDLATAAQHASNLGAPLAHSLAKEIPHCKAYIADPVVVDELDEIARIGGLPQLPRKSTFHALNHKATARKYAEQTGKRYEDLRLIVAHLGGGISIGAHLCGKVIDVNQGLDGYGPFSPERSGTLDAGELVKICFSGKYSEQEINRLLAGKGGLVAHLGSNDVVAIEKLALQGDSRAQLLLNAMAYSIAKEIGAMFAVLKGKTDAIILTGGLAYCRSVVDYVKSMVEAFADIAVFPGENEMEALAFSAFRALNGEEVKIYSIT